MPGDLFQFEGLPMTPVGRAALAAARPLLTRALGLHRCRAIYDGSRGPLGESFDSRVLAMLDVRAEVADDAASVPSEGSLLIASNHPHGALDGLLLASVVRRRRPDVRILANYLLSCIRELSDLCFFVDPFGRRLSVARSQAGLRAAHLWVRNGGALIVFPAGEVAHLRRSGVETPVDSAWQRTIGRLALATGARVLPAHIAGCNSKLFYAAGAVHPMLRTALLARELLNARGRTIAIRFGATISSGDLAASGDPRQATAVVRSATDSLVPDSLKQRPSRNDAISREIAQLPPETRSAESGSLQVYLAKARQIPATLIEIGRLREVTYRAIGEGTGRERDLDRFDEEYLHLFCWDRARTQIVGAYRIARTDAILRAQGVDGLYTRTLFRYDDRLMARLSPALELGRAWVRAEYQKRHNALLVLWKGIGQFVVEHPQYRVLFGPVSISSQYSDTSQELLREFLHQNHLAGDLAGLVEAVNPARSLISRSPAGRTIDETNRLVREAEHDNKEVPVLLRQYLRLNARVLGFNVDPRFGNALDALMMVDLRSVDRTILNRYLGSAGTARFLAHQAQDHSLTAA